MNERRRCNHLHLLFISSHGSTWNVPVAPTRFLTDSWPLQHLHGEEQCQTEANASDVIAQTQEHAGTHSGGVSALQNDLEFNHGETMFKKPSDCEVFDTWSEAFDACRERDRPIVVECSEDRIGEVAKIYPSGSSKTISPGHLNEV